MIEWEFVLYPQPNGQVLCDLYTPDGVLTTYGTTFAKALDNAINRYMGNPAY